MVAILKLTRKKTFYWVHINKRRSVSGYVPFNCVYFIQRSFLLLYLFQLRNSSYFSGWNQIHLYPRVVLSNSGLTLKTKIGGKKICYCILNMDSAYICWMTVSPLQSWSRIYIHTVLRSPFNTTRTCALSRWRGKAGEGNVGPALPQSMTSIILYCQDSLAWYVWSLTVSATFY